MRNKEVIACPIPEKRNERKEGRQAAEPEPGTRRSQKVTMEHHPLPFERKRKNSRETSPGTLAGTKRKEEIMMEHNATVLRRQALRPFWDQMEPGRMEQSAKRPERDSQEPYPEPGNEDGTACQKTRETVPKTLPETTRIEEMMTEQNARILAPKNHGGTCFFLGRVENPIQLQSCLGNKPRNPAGTRNG